MLPEFVHITDGKTEDNTAASNVEVKPGSIVVCDRGYFDTLLMKFWGQHKGILHRQGEGQSGL